MTSLLVSYFLIVISFIAGELISVIVYGNIYEILSLHFNPGEYFIKGIFYLLPFVIFLLVMNVELKEDEKITKTKLLKILVPYSFFAFLYIFFNEINVYTAKDPITDPYFWLNFFIYTILTSFIYLFFSYSFIKKQEIKELFFVFLAILMSTSLYTYTVKKYFVNNRTVSTVVFDDNNKIDGKIIADDENFVYLIDKNKKLHMIGKNNLQMIKIGKEKE